VQLQQVLLNLVMNACDAMAGSDGAGRRLCVSTRWIAGEGVRVSIRDHGRGIPADSLGRVFEPFFTTKPHGLGLGLAVCCSILLAHGGGLSAENHPSGGAVFHFTLPADIAPRHEPVTAHRFPGRRRCARAQSSGTPAARP
jgi:two-component system, LuxR family, sensor kinase FixL